MSFREKICRAVASFLVLPVVSSRADFPGAEENFFFDIPVVVTASKKSESVLATPATVMVLTHEQIRQRGYSHLKDVLRDLPGMETIEYAWVEQGTIVPVRGIIGNNKIVVLVNGMRINPPGGENLRFGADMGVRNAQRIEVVYGPGSTLYGQDAISAVINIITGDAGGGVSLDVGGGLGTNNAKESWLFLGKQAGPWKLSFYTQYTDSDLTRLDKEYKGWFQNVRDTVATSTPALNGFDRWESGLNSFFRLENEASYVQFWHRWNSRSTAEGLSAAGFAYDRRAPWIDSSVVLEGGHTVDFTDTVKLKSVVTYNHYEVSPRTRYIFANGDGASWYMEEWKYALGKSASLEEILQVDFSPIFSFLAGLVGSDFQVVPKASVPGGFDPSHSLSGQGGRLTYFTDAALTQRVDINRIDDYTYQNYAAYAEGTLKADPVSVVVGGRYDKNTIYGGVFNPRGAVICSLNDKSVIKYIYSKAYVPPAPYFTSTIWENDKQFSIANNDVKPEKAVSQELNYSMIRSGASISLSAFYNKQRDLFLPPDANSAANNRGTVYSSAGVAKTLSVPSNAGESTAKGLDMLLSWGPSTSSLWLAFSHVDVDFTVAGRKTGIDGISNNNAKLGATGVFSRLTVSPNLVVRSRPNVSNPVILKDEVRRIPYELNLYGAYRPTPRTEWFVDMRNLTNHRYALRGLFSGEPRPQETFRGSAGVRYSFQ
jgi:outer membrane cobalamin receptor